MDITKIRTLLEKRTSINSETGCWEYLGLNTDGYGQITIDGVFYYVHRLSAQLFLGYESTPDLFVCHKVECVSKACWNPEHLYIGTALTNNIDKIATEVGRNQYSGVINCIHGHEFTLENTYWVKSNNGKMRRQCKECKKDRHRNRYTLVKKEA